LSRAARWTTQILQPRRMSIFSTRPSRPASRMVQCHCRAAICPRLSTTISKPPLAFLTRMNPSSIARIAAMCPCQKPSSYFPT
jgi:hypothetical protein